MTQETATPDCEVFDVTLLLQTYTLDQFKPREDGRDFQAWTFDALEVLDDEISISDAPFFKIRTTSEWVYFWSPSRQFGVYFVRKESE